MLEMENNEMLSFYANYILEVMSPSFLLGAAGMTTISVLSGLHLIWAKFKIDRSVRTNKKKSHMKAVVITSYNGISSIKVESFLPVPEIVCKNQVLIKVMAAGINTADLEMTWGHGRCLRDRFLKSIQRTVLLESESIILGRECSGVVLGTGEGVPSVRKGDYVWAVAGNCLQGLMAEYVVVEEQYVTLKPKNVSFEEAATLPYTAIQAWNILTNEARLTSASVKGKRILIQAGHSPINAFMMQVLKNWGAMLTTTVPTSGLPMCHELGVDDVIVYSVADFEVELRRRKGFDVVINTVGRILHDLCLEVVSPGGKVVTLVSSDKSGTSLSSALPFIPCTRKIRGCFSCFSWAFNKDILTQTSRLVEERKVRPVIGRVYELQDVASGFRHLGRHDNVGKAVLRFSSWE